MEESIERETRRAGARVKETERPVGPYPGLILNVNPRLWRGFPFLLHRVQRA
jgi:hypothetical protein